MAKVLQFQCYGSLYEAEPVKIERKKIYGYKEISALDSNGNEFRRVFSKVRRICLDSPAIFLNIFLPMNSLRELFGFFLQPPPFFAKATDGKPQGLLFVDFFCLQKQAECNGAGEGCPP